jgi:hypothetical protein
MSERHRSKHTGVVEIASLKRRCACDEAAKATMLGSAREQSLRRARQAETGADIGLLASLTRFERSTWMTDYYAYIIGDEGHIESRVNIICDDDEDAKRCAKRLVDGHDVELWQESRKVASFPHKE